MAHFYGTTQGGRGEATRLGHKNTGHVSTAAGWNIGGKVVMRHEDDEDRACDCVSLVVTGGSKGDSKYGLQVFQNDWKVHADAELLRDLTDESIVRAMEEYPEFAQRLKKLVFVNLDLTA